MQSPCAGGWGQSSGVQSGAPLSFGVLGKSQKAPRPQLYTLWRAFIKQQCAGHHGRCSRQKDKLDKVSALGSCPMDRPTGITVRVPVRLEIGPEGCK